MRYQVVELNGMHYVKDMHLGAIITQPMTIEQAFKFIKTLV